MFPLTLAHTGQACFTCHELHPIPHNPAVATCLGCETAVFCNAACEARGKPLHRPVCAQIRAILTDPRFAFARHLPPEDDPAELAARPGIWFQRLQLATRLRDVLLAAAGPDEGLADLKVAAFNLPLAVGNRFSYEPHCAVCFATLRQAVRGTSPCIKLCCEKCFMVFACNAHEEKALAAHSAEECGHYGRMHHIQYFVRTHPEKFGGEFEFVPDPEVVGPRPTEDKWDAYFEWRVPKEIREQLLEGVPCFFHAATKKLSMPLTTLLAMRQFGLDSPSKTSLTVHVVGASTYDGFPSPIWEEIMHQLGHIKVLTVVVIGPELRQIVGPSLLDREFPVGTCEGCTASSRQRVMRMVGELYHDYAAQDTYVKPDLAIAFNTGMGDVDFTEDWRPTVKLLIDTNLPVCFTSWTKAEGESDQELVQSLGGSLVVESKLNPYHSREPAVDPVARGKEIFFFHNYYYMLVNGSK